MPLYDGDYINLVDSEVENSEDEREIAEGVNEVNNSKRIEGFTDYEEVVTVPAPKLSFKPILQVTKPTASSTLSNPKLGLNQQKNTNNVINKGVKSNMDQVRNGNFTVGKTNASKKVQIVDNKLLGPPGTSRLHISRKNESPLIKVTSNNYIQKSKPRIKVISQVIYTPVNQEDNSKIIKKPIIFKPPIVTKTIVNPNLNASSVTDTELMKSKVMEDIQNCQRPTARKRVQTVSEYPKYSLLRELPQLVKAAGPNGDPMYYVIYPDKESRVEPTRSILKLQKTQVIGSIDEPSTVVSHVEQQHQRTATHTTSNTINIGQQQIVSTNNQQLIPTTSNIEQVFSSIQHQDTVIKDVERQYLLKGSETVVKMKEENSVVRERGLVKACNEEETLVYIVPENDATLEDRIFESPAEATPVDIAKILNQGNIRLSSNKNKAMIDHCDCPKAQKMFFRDKDLTKRESPCRKHILDTTDVDKLKTATVKSDLNYLPLNNFLPEILECEEDDTEEFTIEYNNIEDELNRNDSVILPVISNVVKVKEEMRNLDWKLNSQMSGRMINEGLQFFKTRSKDLISDEGNPDEDQPQSALLVENSKRKRASKPLKRLIEDDEAPAVKKIVMRAPIAEEVSVKKKRGRKRNDAGGEVKTVPAKRGRKKKALEYDVLGDNELFVIKKVDILSEGIKRL